MEVVDLFSGCGGLSLGFQNAGFEILAAFDKLETVGKTVPADKTQQYEFQTIRSFVQLLINSSRTFDLIKARCNQYQRG